MANMQLAVMLAALIGAAACADEGGTTTECKQLVVHAIEISPQYREQITGLSEADQRAKLAQLLAKVPVEDFQQCAAADQAAVACMLKAPDVAAIRACIPVKK